jgi:hypothetical protein
MKETESYVSFEVFTAVTMKNAAFWDVTPRGSWKNRRFVGTHRLEEIRFSEISVLTKST